MRFWLIDDIIEFIRSSTQFHKVAIARRATKRIQLAVTDNIVTVAALVNRQQNVLVYASTVLSPQNSSRARTPPYCFEQMQGLLAVTVRSNFLMQQQTGSRIRGQAASFIGGLLHLSLNRTVPETLRQRQGFVRVTVIVPRRPTVFRQHTGARSFGHISRDGLDDRVEQSAVRGRAAVARHTSFPRHTKACLPLSLKPHGLAACANAPNNTNARAIATV